MANEKRRRAADLLHMNLGEAMKTVEAMKVKARELAHHEGDERGDEAGLDREYVGECLVWREALESVVQALLPALWAMKLPHGTITRTDRRAAGRLLKEKVHMLVYPLIPLDDAVQQAAWNEKSNRSEGEANFLCVSKGGELGERTFKVEWEGNSPALTLRIGRDGDNNAKGLELAGYYVESPKELLGDSGIWWSQTSVAAYSPVQYAEMVEQLNQLISRRHSLALSTREQGGASEEDLAG